MNFPIFIACTLAVLMFALLLDAAGKIKLKPGTRRQKVFSWVLDWGVIVCLMCLLVFYSTFLEDVRSYLWKS